MSKDNLRFETKQLHVGQEITDPTGARAVPIYQTAAYVFDNCDHAAARFGLSDAGNIYGRLTNPTEDVFEQRMAALEGGVAALAVASGAAAVTYAIESITRSGDHIVAAKQIYGGTYNLLAHTLTNYGVNTTFVDSDDFISIYTLEIMYEVAINYNSDLVFTKNAVRFNDGDSVIVANNNNIEGITKLFSQDDILEYSFYQKSNVTGAPGKLFSKKIFEDGLRFPYGVYFEDLATTYKFVMRANRIVMIDTPLYAYRMRNDSIIHQKFSTKKLTCIEVTQNLYNDIIHKRPKLKKAAASRCCSCNRMVYSQIAYKDKKNRNLIWNEILKYRKIVILDNKARKRERISCGISYLGQNAFYAFNYIIIYLKNMISMRFT